MSLRENLEKIQNRIQTACFVAGRHPEEITLIGASKGVPADDINEAIGLGVLNMGENYLQEFLAKVPHISNAAVWHYIGKLQSNKTRKVSESFRWIHSVDRIDLARRLAGCANHLLVEVNIGEEPNKSGIFPKDLAKFVETLYNLPGIEIRGLMTMGPVNLNPEEMRPYFQAMRRLLDELKIAGADVLSMGMSSDFEVAIQEGASHIRVGTALFGARKSKDGD